jgi:signal transduction histidine kinase
MRERAAAVGGALKIRSAPGAGTVVRLSVPAARQAGACSAGQAADRAGPADQEDQAAR